MPPPLIGRAAKEPMPRVRVDRYITSTALGASNGSSTVLTGMIALAGSAVATSLVQPVKALPVGLKPGDGILDELASGSENVVEPGSAAGGGAVCGAGTAVAIGAAVGGSGAAIVGASGSGVGTSSGPPAICG